MPAVNKYIALFILVSFSVLLKDYQGYEKSVAGILREAILGRSLLMIVVYQNYQKQWGFDRIYTFLSLE